MGGKAKRSRHLDSRVGHRVEVLLNNGKEKFIGRLLCVETKDGSVALADAERERRTKKGAVVRSQEGFIIVRGFNISSIQVKDKASPIGWAGHQDSLVAVAAVASNNSAAAAAAAGGTGEGKAMTVNYGQMMKELQQNKK